MKLKWFNKHKKTSKALLIVDSIILGLFFFLFLFWIIGKSTFNYKETFGAINQDVSLTLAKEIKYIDNEDEIPYLIKLDKDGQICDDFKIMTTTDLHLNESNNDLTLNVISNFIDKNKPDLVVFDGDNLSGAVTDVKSQNALIDLFEEKKTYWTFVLGNHDGQGWERDKDMPFVESRVMAFNTLTGRYQKHESKYCLARNDVDNPTKFGSGTNCINIKGKNGNILKSLFFFDCETILNENDDVIGWYKQKVQTIKSLNDGNMPDSLLFSHIPFVELSDAYKSLDNKKDVKYNFGRINEPICDNAESEGSYNGLFEEIKAAGGNATLVFGHDHVNNISLTYKGINMMYSLALPYNAYNSRHKNVLRWINNVAYALDNSVCTYIDGVSNFYIEKDKTTIGNQYAQFSGVLDGLKKKLYLKTLWLTYDIHDFTLSLDILLPILSVGGITYITLFIINTKKGKQKHEKALK